MSRTTTARTPAHRTPNRRWPRTALTAVSLTVALGLGACSTTATEQTAQETPATSFFDDSLVHDISVTFSDEDYQAMLATFTESNDKDWISATVTIDGTTLDNVGLRLKGNSSLQSLSGRGGGPQQATGEGTGEGTGEEAELETGEESSGDGEGTADAPETLPWLIRTDKFVEGQQYQGRTDLVVRGNNSETSLNEALALELTGAANLATLEAAATRFSVNDSPRQLRLVIESPDDEQWNADTFGDDGTIYKAESGGDYSYRGDNAEDYTDVFEQKAGEDDLQPVMEFLDFINNSSDEDFTAKLGEHLDVDSFATYLATQELIGNTDDIDGPGNNSYLRYDPATGRMTVVTWDLNLSFGSMMGGGMPGAAGMPDGGTPPNGLQLPDATERPEGFEPPPGRELPDGLDRPGGTERPEGPAEPVQGEAGTPGGMGTMDGNENVLSSRFLADAEFTALYESKLAGLRADLYESGEAQEILDKWTALLTSQASDLVPAETVQEEAADISKFFSGETAAAG